MEIPISDAIIIAISNLIDDAQTETRKPSHYDLEEEIVKSRLQGVDPNKLGKSFGKAKRIKSILSWAIENDNEAGSKLVENIINLIRGNGGFREDSPNYVGEHAIANAIDAFRVEGIAMGSDGVLLPLVIDNLSALDQKKALMAYVNRARRGVEDAALLAGTSKDLLEAVAAYVLTEKFGGYSVRDNFPTLLGQAFISLGLATPQEKKVAGEPVQKDLERSMYESACSINRLRNKQGTGHGHPFVTTLSKEEGKVVISIMGAIAEYMLAKL